MKPRLHGKTHDKTIAALRHELENGPAGPLGDPFSVRFSEETAREIEAEARLTDKSLSDVIRERVLTGILAHIDPATTNADGAADFRKMRRRLMAEIVEMSDEALASRLEFIRCRVIDKRSRDEFSLLSKEINLRREADGR